MVVVSKRVLGRTKKDSQRRSTGLVGMRRHCGGIAAAAAADGATTAATVSVCLQLGLKRQAREKVPRGCYCRLFACFECWRRQAARRRRRRYTESFYAASTAAALEATSRGASAGGGVAKAAAALAAHCRLHVTLLFSYSCFSWIRFPCRFSSSCDCQSATQIVVIVAY